MVRCFSNASQQVDSLVQAEIYDRLRHLCPREVVVKPNWVLHESDSRYPITALVTDSRVILATARACATVFPEARITVCDCPLQRADWPLMCQQSGLAPKMQEISAEFAGRVVFHDLRQEVLTYDHGRLVPVKGVPHGDPAGYREVLLGSVSHLEEISDSADRFSIHDHDRRKAQLNHRKGNHRYFVSQTILNADLIINLPKWKTHSKSGVTGALKNLVGINGDKSYLPHFSRGAPRWGGDEYTDSGRWLAWWQNELRDLTREKAWWAYQLLQPPWRFIKTVRTGLRQMFGSEMPADFYVGGGAWYGNETIWRMIYDLNMVVQCLDSNGQLHDSPQREYFCIVDGLVAGEGNGPLFAKPRLIDWLVFGNDPFKVDATLAWFMGFEPSYLQIIRNRAAFMGPVWGDFDLDELEVVCDGHPQRLTRSAVNFGFEPPPGWIGHVERHRQPRASANCVDANS
jgi:hypothetical protein